VVCPPEESARHHEEMIAVAQDFYKSLGFAFHVVNIVSVRGYGGGTGVLC